MDGKRFIHHIKLQNFLSFGPTGVDLPLEPLNVFVGANGSGKSNFIEAFDVLHNAPTDLAASIRSGGGIDDFLWKGEHPQTLVATIEALVDNAIQLQPLRYQLKFRSVGQRFYVVDERLENEKANAGEEVPIVFYGFQDGRPELRLSHGAVSRRYLQADEVPPPDKSILSEIRDRAQFPEIDWIQRQFGKIQLHTEWNFGRYTKARLPQQPDQRNDALLPDASNLSLVLDRLRRNPKVRKVLREKLGQFYEGFQDIDTSVEGGSVQTFWVEDGLNRSVPATRLSDGTLRYLCLLCILYDPEPPPLVCIEEPELGLHPDLIHAEILSNVVYGVQAASSVASWSSAILTPS